MNADGSSLETLQGTLNALLSLLGMDPMTTENADRRCRRSVSGTSGIDVSSVVANSDVNTIKDSINLQINAVSQVDGSNIQLTINLEYQSILQEELARRIEESKAKGAMAILMDPQTGAILAMSSLPDFDPNQHDSYPVENQKIRVITDQFEPGSTYKIVAATAAVATRKVSLYDENDKVVGTAFPEEYHTLIAKRKENFTIKKMHYAGCPRWNYT